jgi:hypothetical protein
VPKYSFALLPASSSREQLASLWARSSSWGELTPELVDHFSANAPGGSASVVTATEESGELVGAGFFISVRVLVGGRQVKAHRPSAFLIDPAARLGIVQADPRKHPIMGIYFFAAEQFRELGDALLITIPDPRWARILKLIPGMRSATFPLMSLPLPLEADLPWNDAYSARPLVDLDTRVDELGASVGKQYCSTIVRDARSLKWKMNRGDAVLSGVERNGELVGVVLSRGKGDRQWLICDLLSAGGEDALTMTLVAAVHVSHARAIADTSEQSLRKVGILATPRMVPVLEKLGFYRDDYDFPLAVHRLTDEVSAADVAPEGWYITADD